jgi:hypothetical protein
MLDLVAEKIADRLAKNLDAPLENRMSELPSDLRVRDFPSALA